MKDDIIRMAREAGYGEAMSDLHAPALERLVELARADERGACARAASIALLEADKALADRVVQAIRARGNDAA